MNKAQPPANLRLSPATGLLDSARFVSSPNCDDRPPGCVPELIVVHGISMPPGEFGGGAIDALFTKTLDPTAHPAYAEVAGLEVSAHFLIRRDGAITQYVPVTRRAWHAGQSLYCGRERCNDFSIGIELEGTDDLPYEALQYATLAALIQALRRALPSLAHAPVVGHSDIAPGRKTDPGPSFDWGLLTEQLAASATANRA